MIAYQDDILAEVRENRTQLLEQHGGLAGLRQYQRAERPQLEKAGWQFIDIETVRAMNKSRCLIDTL
jgi:hypothetical protein